MFNSPHNSCNGLWYGHGIYGKISIQVETDYNIVEDHTHCSMDTMISSQQFILVNYILLYNNYVKMYCDHNQCVAYQDGKTGSPTNPARKSSIHKVKIVVLNTHKLSFDSPISTI